MFVFLLFYVLLENMMSPLLVKGCKKLSLSSTLWPLSRKGFLSCQTCYDTGPRFLRLHPKDRPNLAAFYKKQGVPMIHSNTHLHHKVECWILNHGHLNIYQIIKHPQKFLTFHLQSPPPLQKKKRKEHCRTVILKIIECTVVILLLSIPPFLQAIGRPFLPPYWSLGFQLCKYGYNSLENMKAAVDRTRNANIPHVSIL